VDFTPEELDLLALATSTYVSEWEGPADTGHISGMNALSRKIELLRLVNKKVRAVWKDAELTGELHGVRATEDGLMAAIASKGYMYEVPAEDVLGEA
jgi:hypothetical protein